MHMPPKASDEMTASARPHALGSFFATAGLNDHEVHRLTAFRADRAGRVLGIATHAEKARVFCSQSSLVCYCDICIKKEQDYVLLRSHQCQNIRDRSSAC